MSGIRLAGSLWSVDRTRVRDEASRLADAGLELWHWDRSDGSMARAGGFLADEARELAEHTGLRSEAHLMLRDATTELDDWLTFCERVVVHVEAADWRSALERIRAAGAEGAVAVAPSTPAEGIAPPAGTAVLVMSVVPGEAGSAFESATIDRVAHWSGGHEVGVDGALDLDRAEACRAAGATWLVSGTGLSGADDPHAWLRAATV